MYTQPKLMDQLLDKIRMKHYSIRTEEAYLDWNKRFILFHKKRHSKDMGAPEVEKFLSFLALKKNVASSTQNQAFSAILFLYKEVLEIDLPWLKNVTRAKKPEKLPVVFSRAEIKTVMAHLFGTNWLMANLLYGAGLRLMECVRLRVKDIDFDYRQIAVRDGKGKKDRVTMLPKIVEPYLRQCLDKVKILHKQDLAEGYDEVYLPYALERKYPRANKEWGWQYVFPSTRRSTDPRSGKIRRHHRDEKSIQRAVKNAIRAAKIIKLGSSHTLRHSFATHLLEKRKEHRC
ncbi:MAG: integron integrase [Desulfobacterales bacterium]|nr:MAG: integron integrase [Desulfobacterales bacterium]